MASYIIFGDEDEVSAQGVIGPFDDENAACAFMNEHDLVFETMTFLVLNGPFKPTSPEDMAAEFAKYED